MNPKLPKILDDMRRASALCDEMIGPGTYATRMIALAMIARQFLRELELSDGNQLANAEPAVSTVGAQREKTHSQIGTAESPEGADE